MKRFFTALLVAFLVACQLLSPAAAAPASEILAAGTCGDTYTVQSGDHLNLIAYKCGISVTNILALNPNITDANFIVVGSLLRLTGAVPTTTTSTGTSVVTTNTGTARVSLSGSRAGVGDVVTVYVSGFPANADVDYRVGQRAAGASVIYDGVINSAGSGDMSVTIPSDAETGEYWEVEVVTTSQVTVVSVTSPSIYIGAYNTSSTTSTGTARVTLSSSQAIVGDQLTVFVSGFPANADVDYRFGPSGSTFSQIYDGKINASGSASQVITIPTDAVNGEYWIVQVITVSETTTTKASSGLIYIGASSGSSAYNSTAKVSLSKTQASAGSDVTVSVSGFPANAYIDFRVGKMTEPYTIVYDGVTDSNGSASQVITIPSEAASGDNWVVKVITTETSSVTSVTSQSITVP